MKQKKVLILAQALNGGGAESFLKNIIEINTKNNMESIVCSSDNTSHLTSFFQTHRIKFCTSRLFYDGNKIKYLIGGRFIYLPFSNYLFWLYEVLSILKVFLKTKADLIVVSNTIQSSQFGYLILPLPVIFFIHSVPFECASIKKKILQFFFNNFSKNKIVTVSNYNGSQIEKILGVPFSKIKIVPNGVKLPEEIYFQNERENIILTVGHFEAYKNVEIWFKVAVIFIEMNPSYQFIWVGSGSLIKQYQCKIKEKNLEESIKLIGHHDFPQVLLKKAKVYFHPSLFETQGISIIEAMVFCLPCIASNIGGIPETITDKENGFLCNPEDVNGFVLGINLLINDTVLYKKIQKAGYETAKINFSLAKNTTSIIRLYDFNK